MLIFFKIHLSSIQPTSAFVIAVQNKYETDMIFIGTKLLECYTV